MCGSYMVSPLITAVGVDVSMPMRIGNFASELRCVQRTWNDQPIVSASEILSFVEGRLLREAKRANSQSSSLLRPQ
jgi:hypothetical protein